MAEVAEMLEHIRNMTEAGDDSGHAQHGEPAFADLMMSLIFLLALWVAGKLAMMASMPALVGEVVVGMLLGPGLADIVPYHEALMLWGEVGLMLLVVEAGLDVDLQMLRVIGARGVGVAVSGSMLPLVIGFGAAYGIGLDWKASLAVGCALAPTSMGIALNVLKRAKVLNTPTGQLIIAAAVLDDVIALVLLAMLQAIGHGLPAISVVVPLLSSVVLMAVAVLVAAHVMPNLTTRIRKSERFGGKRTEQVLLGVLLLLAAGFIPLCHQLGTSHLLGAFLAGLCMCQAHEVHHGWTKQVKRLLQWLLRIFFAATVGFEIPVYAYANGTVILHALLFSLAVIGKLAAGLWAKPLTTSNALTVGLAMSAWGEFAFIIATSAIELGMLDNHAFAALTLAVLMSVLISPLLLRWNLNNAAAKSRERIQRAQVDLASPSADAATMAPVLFHMRISSAATWGMSVKLLDTATRNKLVVLDFRSAQPQDESQVVHELFLEDRNLLAPRAGDPPPDIADAIQKRIGDLMQSLKPLLNAGGGGSTCTVERWIPDDVLELQINVDADAAAAADASADASADATADATAVTATTAAADAAAATTDVALDAPKPPLYGVGAARNGVGVGVGGGGGGDGGDGGGGRRGSVGECPSERSTYPDSEDGLRLGSYKAARPRSLEGFISKSRNRVRRRVRVSSTSSGLPVPSLVRPQYDSDSSLVTAECANAPSDNITWAENTRL